MVPCEYASRSNGRSPLAPTMKSDGFPDRGVSFLGMHKTLFANRAAALFTTLLFLLAGSSLAGCAGARSLSRDARIAGIVELCGGRYPAHCLAVQKGSVTVFNGKHHPVGKEAVKQRGPSKFSFRVVPGRYTLIYKAENGFKVPRSVKA